MAAKRAHLVPDLLAANLRLVFCGTAPSRASAEARAYYAKPGNRFWPSLHAVGLTPRRFAPHEYPALLALGIGLTDLCKAHCGTDAELPDGAFDVAALRAKIRLYRPGMLAFTSKTAAAAALSRAVGYGLQDGRFEGAAVFVLCSPSGLATRYFDLGVWHELARVLTKINNLLHTEPT
jgi:double-stranded uracil-DNA glycosylase